MTSLIFLAFGCAVPKKKLSKAGRSIQVLQYKPKGNCEVVDKVVGVNSNGSVELARNHARNLVAKIGGDSIFINEEVGTGKKWKVFATGYLCNPE